MKLNCKPGDLVLVVGGAEKYIGMIFTVTNLYAGHIGTWETKPEIPSGMGDFVVFYDDTLRPIRDQPGEDETLEWAGLPAGNEVVA